MIDYANQETIERQNISPNAGCMIDGVFYDVRNLIHEVARLTAERDEARATAAAAYERAAQVADHYSDADYCAMGYPEEGGIAASGTADAIRRDIRALATDPGTTALAEMLDAETRACAQIVREKRAGLVGIGVERAILSRIDQRKEAGE